jgi:hypothetical protein
VLAHRIALCEAPHRIALCEARCVMLREARLDGACKEIAFLYYAFFAFHAASIFLIFLSSASVNSAMRTLLDPLPCLVALLPRHALGVTLQVQHHGHTGAAARVGAIGRAAPRQVHRGAQAQEI